MYSTNKIERSMNFPPKTISFMYEFLHSPMIDIMIIRDWIFVNPYINEIKCHKF
jgi:hypothetical protein